jgi:hypothetical protein
MSVKSWFLSWFGISRDPIDAAAGEPLYVAGPLVVERHSESYTVRQSTGGGKARSWSFASAADLKKQIEEFGGAATAPELLAELELAGEAEPIGVDAVL